MDTQLITPCSWSLSTGKLPWHLYDRCYNRSWDFGAACLTSFQRPAWYIHNVRLSTRVHFATIESCQTNHLFSLKSKSISTKQILEWITLYCLKVPRESLPYPCKHIVRNCSTSVCNTISKRPPLREVPHWLGPWGLLNIVHRNARFLRLLSLQLLLLPKYRKIVNIEVSRNNADRSKYCRPLYWDYFHTRNVGKNFAGAHYLPSHSI